VEIRGPAGPVRAFRIAPVSPRPDGAELLDEHRDPRRVTLRQKVPERGQVEGPGPRAPLAPEDDPGDPGEIQPRRGAEPGLDGEEPDPADT
jgi:hypothetical protein